MPEENPYTRITLRIPRTLHARLGEAAARVSHSTNAEIVQRLERSFASSRPTPPNPGRIAEDRARYGLKIPSQEAIEALETALAILKQVDYPPAPDKPPGSCACSQSPMTNRQNPTRGSYTDANPHPKPDPEAPE